MKLSELRLGATGKVSAVGGGSQGLEEKLREVGFSEGDEVEMLGYGPVGGNTLAVRLNRTIIALRVPEAAFVEVDPA